MFSCILSSWKSGTPLNKLFISGGRLAQSFRRNVLAKACCSYHYVGIISWKLACGFSLLLRFVKGKFFGKSYAESERNNQFHPGKMLKRIDHVSNLISCCKMSLLINSGSTYLSSSRPVSLSQNIKRL